MGEQTISKETQERVEALGSNMIMHDVNNDKSSNEAMQNMQDAIMDMPSADEITTTEHTIKGGISPSQFMFKKTRPMVRNYTVRPNDPCPCGSGLKYKKCCKESGKYDGYHTV